MEVVVDGTGGWGMAPADAATLGTILASLRTEASRRHRAIVSLCLDGEELPRDRQEALSPMTAGQYRLLEVRTVDPVRLSLDTLSGLTQHLANMEGVHREGGRLVRDGHLERAAETFEACFAGWEIVLRAVRDVSRLAGMKLTELTPDGISLEDRMQRLQKSLLTFRTAFGSRDLVTVGDVSEFELVPAIGEWKRVLEHLQQLLSRPGTTG